MWQSQQREPPLGMPLVHRGVVVWILALPLPLQLPANSTWVVADRLQYLGACQLCGRHAWDTGLLASTWYIHSCCRHLGNKSADGRLIFVFLCHSSSQIHRNRKIKMYLPLTQPTVQKLISEYQLRQKGSSPNHLPANSNDVSFRCNGAPGHPPPPA